MAAPHGPIGSRRRLGAELRRLRNHAGLTLDEVAGRMTCSTSKISRLETGKGIPKVPDVRELMRIYGVGSEATESELLRLVHDAREHGWWEPLADAVQPERYVLDSPGRYPALENDATSAWTFSASLVHGLLQTEDYARTMSNAFLPHHSTEDIDRLVELRAKRQDALRRSDPPPLELVALLDEAVLNRQVGGPEIMTAQLRHIRDLTELPSVTVHVLPFAAGALRAHVGDFTILGIPEALGSDVVFTEGHAGDSYLDSKSDVDRYREVHVDALRQALDADGSGALIDRYVQVHRHPSGRRDP